MAWMRRSAGSRAGTRIRDAAAGAACALALSVGSTVGGVRAQGLAPPLPVKVPDGLWKPLPSVPDPTLQARLDEGVRADPVLTGLAGRAKLAIGLVDLTDPASPRFARVNGDQMMYAASLPKIAILLAAYVAIEDGTLKDSPAVQQDLGDMIRVSSNAAATRMIDRLSYEKIAAVMTDPRFSLYDAHHGGGLWVGKRYAKSGRRFPDPVAGLSHAATATQVCRFYYMLATGRMLGAKRSAEMLAHLGTPGLHHGFVGVLDRRAPRAKVFRKSGSWSIWFSDSVLVWGPVWRRYILVGMIEDPGGASILRGLVPLAEKALRPGVG